MEKENNQARAAARKKYSSTVQVGKRSPMPRVPHRQPCGGSAASWCLIRGACRSWCRLSSGETSVSSATRPSSEWKKQWQTVKRKPHRRKRCVGWHPLPFLSHARSFTCNPQRCWAHRTVPLFQAPPGDDRQQQSRGMPRMLTLPAHGTIPLSGSAARRAGEQHTNPPRPWRHAGSTRPKSRSSSRWWATCMVGLQLRSLAFLYHPPAGPWPAKRVMGDTSDQHLASCVHPPGAVPLPPTPFPTPFPLHFPSTPPRLLPASYLPATRLRLASPSPLALLPLSSHLRPTCLSRATTHHRRGICIRGGTRGRGRRGGRKCVLCRV